MSVVKIRKLINMALHGVNQALEYDLAIKIFN